MFLHASFKHRKVVFSSFASLASAARETAALDPDTREALSQAAAQTVLNQSRHHANTTEEKEEGAGGGGGGYRMTEVERHTHDLKCRLTISLSGGRALSSRVFDFFLSFLSFARRFGSGPFQSVSDNNEGIMWIDLTSMIDLVAKSFNRFPSYLLRAVIAKMHNKATLSRNTLMNMGGITTTSGVSKNIDILHSIDVLSDTGGAGGLSSSALASAAAFTSANRFVDYDLMMEVIVESYLDEDARMHHTLYDLFLNPNPQAGVSQHVAREAAAALAANTAAAAGGGQNKGGLKRSQTLKAAAAAAAAASALNLPPGGGVSLSLAAEEELHATTAAFLAASELTPAHDPSLILEPEMFSFVHFCDVIRSLGSLWDEDRLLRIYQQSVQRAVHRPVSIEDFVLTARCHGIMPVEIDWDLVTQSSKQRNILAASNALLPSLDEGLPPLANDGLGETEEDVLERRHQELKDKMREAESTYIQKLEHFNRRHDKEIAQLKQLHEREMTIIQQAHQQQLDAGKVNEADGGGQDETGGQSRVRVRVLFDLHAHHHSVLSLLLPLPLTLPLALTLTLPPPSTASSRRRSFQSGLGLQSPLRVVVE
jgi:hypothetical protein